MLCFKKGIKWWILILIGICLFICGILMIVFFLSIARFLIELQLNYIYDSPNEWWTHSSDRLIKIYVFNVTNPNEFLANKSSPILNELGPYVYDEKWEYINVVKNPNGTISFNLNVFREFRRDLSSSSETDLIVTPNIEILTKNPENSDLLFKAITLKQLLWSTDNPRTGEIEMSGLFQTRNDITLDRVTVFTENRKKGVINKYNGQSQLTNWLTNNCNRLNGSFSSIFPKKLTKIKRLDIFNNDLKRILPLYYKKDKYLPNGIQAKRYVMPEDFYENTDYDAENLCYCPVGVKSCSDSKNSGLFKVSLNETDSHLIYSLPHFYLADKSLRKAFKGISSPEKKTHQMYADIHPITGLMVRYRTGLQINFVGNDEAIKPSTNQTITNNNDDIKYSNQFSNLIFPLIWFDEIYENLPDDLNQATIIPRKILFGILIGCLLVGILILVISVYCLCKSSHKEKRLQININMDKVKTDPNQAKVNVKKSSN